MQKTNIHNFGGGGLEEGVGQPSWPGSTNDVSGVEKKKKMQKKYNNISTTDIGIEKAHWGLHTLR